MSVLLTIFGVIAAVVLVNWIVNAREWFDEIDNEE
jgi:hypothetical protein